MKELFRYSVAVSTLLFSILACRDEFHQLTPPEESTPQTGVNSPCQASSIEKNIVGTWHFASTYNREVKMKEGTVTFHTDKKITDPDSLFENEFDIGTRMGRVISKTYNPSVFRDLSNYSGYIFDVYLKTKESSQTDFFIVLNNDCSKIVMVVPGSYNDKLKITLTR